MSVNRPWGLTARHGEVLESNIITGKVRAVDEPILAGCEHNAETWRSHGITGLTGPSDAKAAIRPPHGLHGLGGEKRSINIDVPREVNSGGLHRLVLPSLGRQSGLSGSRPVWRSGLAQEKPGGRHTQKHREHDEQG